MKKLKVFKFSINANFRKLEYFGLKLYICLLGLIWNEKKILSNFKILAFNSWHKITNVFLFIIVYLLYNSKNKCYLTFF